MRNIIIATNLLEKAEIQYKQFIVEFENLEISTEEDIDEALSGDIDIDEHEITEEDDNDSWTDSGARTLH